MILFFEEIPKHDDWICLHTCNGQGENQAWPLREEPGLESVFFALQKAIQEVEYS